MEMVQSVSSVSDLYSIVQSIVLQYNTISIADDTKVGSSQVVRCLGEIVRIGYNN